MQYGCVHSVLLYKKGEPPMQLPLRIYQVSSLSRLAAVVSSSFQAALASAQDMNEATAALVADETTAASPGSDET